MSADDPRYFEGIRRFNEQDFFNAHEVWEELWHETQGKPRNFIQGLINAAVCLYHFENQNLQGAGSVCQGACELLEPYQPEFMGLNVARLLVELKDVILNGVPRAVILNEVKDPDSSLHSE